MSTTAVLEKVSLAWEDVETIVNAQEIIYLRRMLMTMRKFFDECPTPPRPHGDGPMLPLKLVQNDLNKIVELQALRAKYVRRVHVDPDCAAAVAKLCRENANLAQEIAEHK
jgi:hypothetical protein